MDMNIEKIQAKTLIRTSNRSPHHIHMNLYQGCYHNCSYCNGTSDNYHMHDDFGATIKAKINASELFEEYLVKKGLFPFNRNGTTTLDEYIESKSKSHPYSKRPNFLLSLFGNVCDIYQPAEEELKLTRQLLHIAYDYGIPVRLLTKSDLVLRDLDIIKKINETSFARVAFTVTLMNEIDQRNIEPNASSTSARIHAIKEFRNAGIPSGAYVTPVIPFIGDTEENLDSIFVELYKANAEFVITGGLTLKSGRNKDTFMRVIMEKYPHVYDKIFELYSNNDSYGQPDQEIAHNFQLLKPVVEGYNLAKKHRINFFEPRFIPNVKFRKNLEITTYLARIGFLMREIFFERMSEAHQFRKAAAELEYLKSDISKMSEAQIKKLNISQSVISTITEILNDGKSTYLENKGDFGNLLYCK